MDNKHSYRLSIIVPVYNVEKYIEACIESIRMQTFQDYEVILVDDGSTDRSADICDKYASDDSRVTVIHKPNAGVSSARNKGLDIASGEYIYFIDPDDILADKNVFQELMSFTNDPDVDLIAGRGDEFVDRCELPARADGIESDHRKSTSPAEVRAFIFDPLSLLMLNIYSERILRDIRFDTRLSIGEDILFLAKAVSRAHKAVLYERIIYHRRLRPESASHADYREGFFEEDRLFHQLMYEELHGMPEGDAILEKYYVDQTGLINRLSSEHRKYRKEVRIVRQRIIKDFPHYLKNRYMGRSTKLFLTLFGISPDLFYLLLRPYRSIKLFHLSNQDRMASRRKRKRIR